MLFHIDPVPIRKGNKLVSKLIYTAKNEVEKGRELPLEDHAKTIYGSMDWAL